MEKDDSVRKSPMDRQPIRVIVRSSIDSAYRFLYAVVKIRGLTWYHGVSCHVWHRNSDCLRFRKITTFLFCRIVINV